MSTEKAFFVPFTNSASEAESAYVQLAAICHTDPPVPNQRIHSINFKHNGEAWVATVGERLKGSKVHVSKTKGVRNEHEVSLSDPAIVVAIFPGNPYFVATAVKQGAGRSAWENPFMAGNPSRVIYFSVNQ